MNEKLRDRFDALSSSSDDEQLSWAAMEPAIQEALGEKKKKRRALLWWWFGGTAAVLLIGAILVYPNYVSKDAVATATASTFEASILQEESVERQSVTVGLGEEQKDLQSASEIAEPAGEIQDGSNRKEPSAFAKTTEAIAKVRSYLEEQSRSPKPAVPSETYGTTSFSTYSVKDEQQLSSIRQEKQQEEEIRHPESSVVLETHGLPSALMIDEQRRAADGSSLQDHAEFLKRVLQKGEQNQSTIKVVNQKYLDFLPSHGLDLLESKPVELRVFEFLNVKKSGGYKQNNLNKSLPALYLTAFSGGQLGEAAVAYNQAENTLGYTAGLGLEYELSSGWFGGLGIRTDRTNFTTQATLLDTVREYRAGQVGRVYTFSNNQFIIEFSDSVDVQYTRNVLHHNTQTDLVLPIHLGYRWSLGKWGLALRGGVNTHLQRLLEGRLLTSAGEILDVNQRESRVLATPHLGAEVSYRVRENWNLSIRAVGQQSATVPTLANEQSSRFWLGQLQLGLRYRIIK